MSVNKLELYYCYYITEKKSEPSTLCGMENHTDGTLKNILITK